MRKKKKENQLDVLKATYRVSGSKAALVETSLVRFFQMEKLRFACCGWESLPDHFSLGKTSKEKHKSEKIYPYQTKMYSEETIVRQREEWKKINSFYVTVILPLEEP